MEQEPLQFPQKFYDFHLKKKKENNTGAWVALGVGHAMLVGSIIMQLTDNIFGSSNRGLLLTCTGVAMAFVNIPLFVANSKHKKAVTLQMQRGVIGLGLGKTINYTGITLKFHFKSIISF